MTEDEMVGWHHRLDGHEFEQALGVGDGQGSLPGVLQSMGLQRTDYYICCCGCSVAKLGLTLHGLQHARLPCPSLSPRVCSNSCPLSW